MTMRTFNIELRVDDSDSTRLEVIRTAARMAAKHLYTTALLCAGDRKPQIALSSGDMFEAEQEISLADDIPQDEENVVSEEEPA